MDTNIIDPNIQKELTGLIGGYGWVIVVTLVVFLFRTTIEGIVSGMTTFIGKGLDADDCIFIYLNGHKVAARIIRVGLIKSVIIVYNVGHTKDGSAYITDGEKLEIQNVRLKEFIITKPMSKIDLSSFEDDNGHSNIS